MSTHDVPGARTSNGDSLHAGCWAEHDDGSLIYVKGTEGGTIVYEIYDLETPDDPICYTDAMAEQDFKRRFTHDPADPKEGPWTWHDKTPFDWKRVMRQVGRPRPERTSAAGILSAAARVARSLSLRARQVREDDLADRVEREAPRTIWEDIKQLGDRIFKS